MQRPDGTEGTSNPVVFNLTQKGEALTGTAGPADRQWKVEKGAVNAAAEIEVHAEAGMQWGDIHLQTRSGPVTLWAVADPAAVWERLRALRDSGS